MIDPKGILSVFGPCDPSQGELYSTNLPFLRLMLISMNYNLFIILLKYIFYLVVCFTLKKKPKSSLTLQYVATLREQLEQLAEEKTPEGLPR